MAISVSLAFVKIHGKPLIAMVEAAVKYYFGDKLYVWRKEDKPATPTTPKEEIEKAKSYAGVMVPKISNSKLKDLTWSLDIKESMYTKMDQK
jgi:hypothetical protein